MKNDKNNGVNAKNDKKKVRLSKKESKDSANKTKGNEIPIVKIRKKKGKISLVLGILLLMASIATLVVATVSLVNEPKVIVPLCNKIALFINPNFSFIASQNIGLYPTAIVFLIFSLSIFNNRRYKPFSYINLLIGVIFLS